MENDVRIASVVFNSVFGDIDSNLKRMEPFIRYASDQNSTLICFPEMNITGYCSDNSVKKIAVNDSGPISQYLMELASKYAITILAGIAEIGSDNSVFATHLVVSPSGKSDKYRKLYIAPPEKQTFSPGTSIPVFESSGLKFGIQLCYDAHFPELSSRMAEKGVDAIFIPHASPRGNSEEKFRSWMRHIPARAFDNSIFVIVCNQVGPNGNNLYFPGLSFVTDPSGTVVAKSFSDTDDILITTLKKESLDSTRNHRMKYFFPNRRPELYK